MKLIKLLFVSTFMLFASVAYADPAVQIDLNGCGLCDANFDLWFSDDCEAKLIFTDGVPEGMVISGSATLPEGAAIPDRAMHYQSQDCGFSGCFVVGDESKWTLTPTGRTNFWCRIPD